MRPGNVGDRRFEDVRRRVPSQAGRRLLDGARGTGGPQGCGEVAKELTELEISYAARGWARRMWGGLPDTRTVKIEVLVFFATEGVTGFAGTGGSVLGVGVEAP